MARNGGISTRIMCAPYLALNTVCKISSRKLSIRKIESRNSYMVFSYIVSS